MSIERMKSIWLFAPRGKARNVLDHLAQTGLCHIAESKPANEQELDESGVAPVPSELTDLQHRVQLLRETLETLSRFHKISRDFLANFITTPIEVRKADVVDALAQVNIDDLSAQVKALARKHSAALTSAEKAREALKVLSPLEGTRCSLPGANSQRHMATFLGVLSASKAETLLVDERLTETCVIETLAGRNKKIIVQAACEIKDRSLLEALLREYDCQIIEPEAETVTVPEYLAHHQDLLAAREAEFEAIVSELTRVAEANLRNVEMLLGYWEERLRIAGASDLLAESRRMTILKGYVRDKDMGEFQRHLTEALPEVGMEVRDPVREEQTPVSLKNPKLLTPAQFTISMFGMPNYFTFDATPIVFFNFTIFFGICFGDALYGLGLIAVGLWLAKKYREYVGLRNLFTLLAYAGVPTFIVGVLTGSWGGSLLSKTWLGSPNPFFSETNPLVVFTQKFVVFNMLDQLMIALVIALGIGVVNQFIGMICLSVSRYRKGDPVGAVLDSVFWFIALPAGIVLASTLFVDVPGTAKNIAFGALGVGAVGLIATQGRDQKNIFARIGIGIVSLYGVAGTYGFSSFLNDVLSYSRLLALGLATSIVGMAFNILANMAGATGIAALDIIIVLAILIPAHAANFFLSVLGSFVHSVRLVFVEFFGRFYEADAPAFAPIGTWSGRIRVIDAKTVWADQ